MKSKLLLGDCYDLIPTLSDCSVDIVITDPPYSLDNQGGGFFNKDSGRQYLQKLDKIDCCEFTPEPMLDLLEPKMKQFYGYFFCNKTLVSKYIQWAENRKYSYDLLVMAKENPIPAHNGHHVSDLEYLVLIREPKTYFNSKGLESDDYKKFYLTTCKKRMHPAEKPVELLRRFIRVSCPKGGTVLDCFMGSASTGIASLKEDCSFIGIEKNDEYYKLSADRIKEYENEQKGIGILFEGLL